MHLFILCELRKSYIYIYIYKLLWKVTAAMKLEKVCSLEEEL